MQGTPELLKVPITRLKALAFIKSIGTAVPHGTKLSFTQAGLVGSEISCVAGARSCR